MDSLSSDQRLLYEYTVGISRGKFHHQQIYIYNMIDGIQKQPIEVQRITLKNLQYNAFALFPENVLFSMGKSDEPEVREEGIKRILAIR